MRAILFVCTLGLCLWAVALAITFGVIADNHDLGIWWSNISFALAVLALTIYVFPT